MFTREFWLGDSGALVRSVRTAAQTALAALGVGQTNLFSADWKNVAALASSAAILSLLMSLDRRESLLAPSPVNSEQQPTVEQHPAYGCSDSLR